MSDNAATGDKLAKDTDDSSIIAECMARLHTSGA